MIIAVDFDGTCVEHEYPAIGHEAPGCIDTLLALQARGDQLILWTMRSGARLMEAVQWLSERGVKLHGINRNPDQHTWTDSPKAYAQVYIDDAALGCPLIHPGDDRRPYVDWARVREELNV